MPSVQDRPDLQALPTGAGPELPGLRTVRTRDGKASRSLKPGPADGEDDPGRGLHGRRVAVTGAAGFIGSRLTERLTGLGVEVVAIDCLLGDSYPVKVKRAAWDSINALDGTEGHLLDLRSDRLEPVLTGVEAVFHLAAMTGLHDEVEPAVYLSCNVDASARLARACLAAGVERFIHASTSSVYGRIATGNETSALEPISAYGRTKLQTERLLEGIAEGGGFGLTILRLFSVFGPGQRPDMAYHRLIRAALEGGPFEVFGDGEQGRSNTYIDDIVDGFLRSTSPAAIGATMNIAGGETVTLNHAIEIIERLTGRPIERVPGQPRPGDQLRTAGDWSRARDLIGFEPRTSFEEGIARQIEWQAAALVK